jgi:UDP-2,3-diacylglucosamine hydrolase
MNDAQQQPDRALDSVSSSPLVNHEPTVIFVSDTHFHLEPDASEAERLEQFIRLLDYACGADELVLLGDIFDFWFDYRHFRLKGYDGLLQALDRVREAGTRIHFIGGNHDIWAAAYFHQRYGSSPDGASEIRTWGSRRVLLNHGDGLHKFDWAYNSFRAVVRTQLGIVLAKCLHPEMLFTLSTWLSGHSRGATRDEASKIQQRARRWFDRQSEPPWDLLVMGHVHHGFLLDRDHRQLAALAGWFDPLSYGLLRNGQFQLLDFVRDPLPTL